MSQEHNDGGPAFPVSTQGKDPSDRSYGHQDSAQTWQFPGMTLRDYFAAKAMQAEMITTWSDATPESADAFAETAARLGRSVEDHLALNAYLIADAMLKAREA